MMQRDSLFGETVLWSGRPKAVLVPGIYRGAAIVSAVSSAIATTSAIVVATALRARPDRLLLFAAWMAIVAVAFWRLPRWWLGELEFLVTDVHVIVRRGRFRRFIERRAVSFARIHWHKRHPGIGDLELVRAVPTGALRRRLSVVLSGLVAPDRVWAIIRGVTPSAPAGDGHRLLAQRLDDGERVLWTSQPVQDWRVWLPTSLRAASPIPLAALMGATSVWIALHAIRALRTVAGAGMEPESISFVALAASLSLTIVLLAVGAVAVLYAGIVRPARLVAVTRYLVTDRRVLIQQGDDELHLDRSRIVDVIDAPNGRARDLFLVLDGPKARALAAGGAFGEAQNQGLQPVFYRIDDADNVRQILLSPAAEPLSDAA